MDLEEVAPYGWWDLKRVKPGNSSQYFITPCLSSVKPGGFGKDLLVGLEKESDISIVNYWGILEFFGFFL
jgi:hypothetical protein